MNSLALTQKLYTGNLGWTSTTVHAVRVHEYEDGKSYNGEPYAICAPNTGMHYRIGRVTNIRQEAATRDNVTCKKCLKCFK
jgi:hypothetical protein